MRYIFLCLLWQTTFASAWSFHLGPLFDDFRLTLEQGHRTEVAGPIYYFEERATQRQWAAPPLFSWTRDPAVESEEFDLFYPLLTYDRFGEEYRFQIFQVFAFAGGQTQEAANKHRFTLFPFYFQQFSSDPALRYFALVPLYGHLQNRLFKDDIRFIGFPLYSRTRKKDVITDNYLYPVFHLRRGDGLRGWQVWPLVGHEQKEPTHHTNVLDQIEVDGGHDKWFGPWPIFFNSHLGLGTENPEWEQAVLPLYSFTRSPQRDSTTYFWPFGLTITDDREKKYREVGFPWPLIVFARGEGKRTDRVWPLFSRAKSATQQSDFLFWPIYKYNRLHSDPLDRSRLRIVFFLYSDISEKNTETGIAARRTDLWPLFTARRDFNGNERLQILSIIEPVLPNNKSIERDYSPLYALWRSEKNGRTGAASQSLLWNLYRHERGPDGSKSSAFFGLFQSERTRTSQSLRLFYIPIFHRTSENR